MKNSATEQIWSWIRKVIKLFEESAPYILLGIILVEAGMLVWYQFVTFKVAFESDAAGVNIFTEEMLRTQSLLPKSWYYIDGLPVLQNHLYALPFLFFMRNTFVLHAITGVINCAMFLGMLYWFLRRAGLTLMPRLVVMSIAMSGISGLASLYMYGHGYYGSMITWYLLILGLAIPRESSVQPDSPPKEAQKGFIRRAVLVPLLIVIFTTLVGMGGIRPVIVFTLPLLASLVAMVILSRPDQQRIILVARSFVALCLGCILGYFFYTRMGEGLRLLLAKQSEGLASAKDIFWNIKFSFLGILDLIGALPQQIHGLLSFSSIFALCKFFIFGFILVLPVFLLFRLYRIRRWWFRFLVVYTVINLALTIFFLLFSRVVVEALSLRYFLYQLFLHIIVFGMFFQEFWLENKQVLQKSLAYPFLIIAVLMPVYLDAVYIMVDPYSQRVVDEFRVPVSSPGHNRVQPLADLLVAEHIEYGYATYWNAGVTTILTGSRARIRQVDFVDGLPVPAAWLSSSDWYYPPAHQGRTCLIFTQNEAETLLSTAELEKRLGPPEEIFQAEEFTVYTYAFNIDEKLNWHPFYKSSVETDQ